MKRATVFLVVFVLFLLISLGYENFSPGQQIYDATIGDDIGAYTSLVVGVFNGVVWGLIIYMIYFILFDYVFKKEPMTTIDVKS